MPTIRQENDSETHATKQVMDSAHDETLTRPATMNLIDAEMPRFAGPSHDGEIGRLGRYRIQKELGRGGMGAVYLAFDERLQRKLALKVMLPKAAANATAKERFLREARAAAQISSDHVVNIFEADEIDGIPFIALQFLQGYPLDEYLKKKGNLTLPQIVRIAADTALGLAKAHKLGIVHRDIKPGNLWLEAPTGRVKILDFGLAKPVLASEGAELTGSGAVMGTPAYMAPEQGMGKPVDVRADLFSLGCVLYRLCTGKLPFDRPTIMAILTAIATEEPPPVREVNSSVPEPLAELIRRLMAKNPDHRPASAQDVVKELDRISAMLKTDSKAEASTSQPHVVYVPIAVSVIEPNPFADIGAPTEVEDSQSQVELAPRPPKKISAKWVGSLSLGVIALVAAAGIIIKIKNKDGTETEIKVPDGSTVTVAKDGKVLGRFGPDTEIKVPDGSTVTVAKDGKVLGTFGPDTKKEPSKTPPTGPFDHRKAAEFVLSIGGTVGINDATSTVAELPKEPFRLTIVNFPIHKQVNDANLAIFKDCNSLSRFSIDESNDVSDAGLANFKDCKRLHHLIVRATKVSDAGLAHFDGCKLTFLYLNRTQVTDTGLKHFKDCEQLKQLSLSQTKIGDAGLANFKGCTNLSILELAHTQVTDAGLIHFKDCKNLKSLDVSFTQVAGSGFTHFKECKSLTSLFLDNTPLTDSGAAHFQNCHQLILLGLHNTKVSDVALANFKNCQSLKELHLGGTQITDAGLANFKNCHSVKELRLAGTQITDAGLANFENCKKTLGTLHLDNTKVTDAGLAHFKDCKNLTQVNLQKTKVTAKGIEEFAKALPKCKIKWDGGTIGPSVGDDRKAAEFVISLGGAVKLNGDANEIKAIADLPKAPYTLTDVNHRGNTQVTDEGLAQLKDCTRLTGLYLSFTGVSDKGVAHLKNCTELTTLTLESSRGVTDVGLAHLKNCKALTWLNLGGTGVTDAGLNLIQNSKALTHLYLNGTGVTDAGLARLKDCASLSVLFLSDTEVTDTGLAHIKDCRNLTALRLGNTKVTNASLETLVTFKKLTSLDVRKTKFTHAEIKKVAAALPKCKIEWDGGIIEPK
jgi:serine/threonine protein kinase/Leucine-rich repeat (LRR) protein